MTTPALALLEAGWLGWRTWSPPRGPAVSIATVNDKLATAPRLSSAAVICNKSVSYTQDAPPQVVVRRIGEQEIRLIGLWLVECALCVTPVAADEDLYDRPTAIKPLTVTPQPQHSAPPNTVCDFEHQCYPEKGGPMAPLLRLPPPWLLSPSLSIISEMGPQTCME